MAGKKGCGGKKGRSGRKPKWFEEKYNILEDLCIDRALDIMQLKFQDIVDAQPDQKPDMILDFKHKNKIMLEVIGKGLPQRIKVDGKVKHEGEIDHYHKHTTAELDQLEATILGQALPRFTPSEN